MTADEADVLDALNDPEEAFTALPVAADRHDAEDLERGLSRRRDPR